MSAAPVFIPAGDVAARLGLRDAAAFRRRRRALEEDGFPLPMPWSSGRTPLWRAAAVDGWIDAVSRLAAEGVALGRARLAPNDVAFARAMALQACA
jgi:hypothetical protein